MSRDRLYRTEAVVLKRHDFGEADRLLTLFTPDRGKLRVIAKGVRRPTSRKSGHVELLTHTQLLIAKGRNLDIVTQAQAVNAFLPLREDLLRLTYGYYVAELIDQFVEDENENRLLFDLLLNVLGWLSQTGKLALTVRYFELRLLGLTGYQPQLFHCVECHTLLEPQPAFFHPGQGGAVCARCGATMRGAQPLSLPALKVLRFLQTRDYAQAVQLRLSPPTEQEVERILLRYITHLLERSLKSVEFLEIVRQVPQVQKVVA